MADKDDRHEDDAVEEGGNGGAEAEKAGEADPQREGFADPLEFLNAELEKAEAEKAELADRAIRLAAEMENLRKRTRRDVEDARNYSIAGFAREMLAVSDNLKRALEAIPEEARRAGDDVFRSLIEGVELTERSMLQALEKSGVRQISPINERFDPNFHQAMFEVPNPDVPNNTVLEVVQDGFVIGDRVLRPAMVGVAKGGPKIARPSEADGSKGNSDSTFESDTGAETGQDPVSDDAA